MELSLSGNALKTFTRSVTCLARVGTELVLVASPSKVSHPLPTSTSTSLVTPFPHPPPFSAARDPYPQLLALRIPDRLLPPWLLRQLHPLLLLLHPMQRPPQIPLLRPPHPRCRSRPHRRAKKTYWITCNVDPDVQQLSLDRRRFPSSLVVRPRDLARLLANFQSSLQEITIIATETSAAPSHSGDEIGGKAVELRSYIDPTKGGASIVWIIASFGG
ncbi:hypothetical protein B296_00029150 [Ensete ventricosum]|uniref:Uncharacterized protein n=1 Tax=Ensete ventricosum TaxID=4639 RepID=A0A426YT82_ENSVE|nr:hypothetical protein B296_00029150 [Ensete ventricosum]